MSKISLLPKNVGEKVIKIALSPGNGEAEKAILFVTKGGCIWEHSHEEGKNPNSERYTHLLREGKIGINTAVAGNNSPTNRKIHGIVRDKDYPQISLATKKGQEEGEWEDFSIFSGIKSFEEIEEGKFKIVNTSGKRQETIIIDTIKNTVTYFDDITSEFATLDGLLKEEEKKTEEKGTDRS